LINSQVDQQLLRQFETRLAERKRDFRVLLLGPGWPEECKREYRDNVKQVLGQEFDVTMVEEYTTKVPLDDKFVLIAERKNLIAAILVGNCGKEGVSWELGFLEGSARGFDKASGRGDGLRKLIESVVIFVQTQAERLITRMMADGMFTKVEVQNFTDVKDLIEALRVVCERKLYQSYRPDLWP
jgi:hypothetical protein